MYLSESSSTSRRRACPCITPSLQPSMTELSLLSEIDHGKTGHGNPSNWENHPNVSKRFCFVLNGMRRCHRCCYRIKSQEQNGSNFSTFTRLRCWQCWHMQSHDLQLRAMATCLFPGTGSWVIECNKLSDGLKWTGSTAVGYWLRYCSWGTFDFDLSHVSWLALWFITEQARIAEKDGCEFKKKKKKKMVTPL